VQFIPLAETPDHYFDQAAWQSIQNLCDGRCTALGALDDAECYYYSKAAEQCAQRDTDVGQFARRNLETVELVRHQRQSLLGRLADGSLVATAMQFGERERVIIPKGLWPYLKVKFANNTASGQGCRFFDITIGEQRSQQTSLIQQCIAWLRVQEPALRKVLHHRASEHFGAGLTDRVFAAAYSEVFRRKRGRPVGR